MYKTSKQDSADDMKKITRLLKKIEAVSELVQSTCIY